MVIDWLRKARSALSSIWPGLRRSEATTQLILFIPSVDRDSNPINQRLWIHDALQWLGMNFGGATAFPRGLGVWRDDARGGHLVFDRTVVLFCYTTDEAIKQNEQNLREFMLGMGRETNQGSVAFVIDRYFIELPING